MVSIIVPVYNVDKYLDKCVKSLTLQTYKDIEIFLVDDGSTDLSANMCDNWEMRDTRIRVIHKSNEGPSSARNCGLAKAKGEYIMFVDGDDFVDMNYVKYLYEEISTKNLDMVMCNYFYVDENGTPIDINNYCYVPPMEHMNNIKALLCFEDQKYGTFFDVVWNKIYKKTLFQSIRFPEGIALVEDVYVLPKLYYISNHISIISDRLYYYVNRSNSLTRGTFTKFDDYKFRKPMMEDRVKDYIMWGVKELILIQYIHLYTIIAQHSLTQKEELYRIQKQYRYYYVRGKYHEKIPLLRKLKFLIAAWNMPAYQFLIKEYIDKQVCKEAV